MFFLLPIFNFNNQSSSSYRINDHEYCGKEQATYQSLQEIKKIGLIFVVNKKRHVFLQKLKKEEEGKEKEKEGKFIDDDDDKNLKFAINFNTCQISSFHEKSYRIFDGDILTYSNRNESGSGSGSGQENRNTFIFISERTLPYANFFISNFYEKLAITVHNKQNKDDFKKYKLGKLIGKGSSANVFLSSCKKRTRSEIENDNEESVIVKVSSFQATRLQANPLRDELLALLEFRNNPYIVNVLDYFTSIDRVSDALVLQHENGFDKTLSEYLIGMDKIESEADKKLPIKYIMSQLLAAVNSIHQKGWIHMDIKPENILLQEKTFRIKLIDFGLAIHEKDDHKKNSMRGTSYFMAPEMFRRFSDYTNDKDKKDKDQGDKEQGDKEQGDKDKKDKEQGDKEQGDKEQGDKDKKDKDQGDKISFKADMFSIGVVFHLLLTRRYPLSHQVYQARQDFLQKLSESLGSDKSRLINDKKLIELATPNSRENEKRYFSSFFSSSLPTSLPTSSLEERNQIADLLEKLLDLDETTRIDSYSALDHSWFSSS